MHDAGQQAGEISRAKDEDLMIPLNSITTKREITRTFLCIRISRRLLYIAILSQKQTHEKRKSEKEEGWDQSTPHMPVSTWLNESQLRSGQRRRTFRPFPFEQRREVPQASLSSSIRILVIFFPPLPYPPLPHSWSTKPLMLT